MLNDTVPNSSTLATDCLETGPSAKQPTADPAQQNSTQHDSEQQINSELEKVLQENQMLRHAIEVKTAGIDEAERSLRAAARNKVRLEEDIKSLVRKLKAKEVECEKFCDQISSLQAQLGTMQAELLIGRNAGLEDAQTSISLDGEQCWTNVQGTSREADRQDLEDKLDQCRAQLERYCEKLKEAAIGWERCEGKAKAREQRIVELEFEMECKSAKLLEKEAFIEELQILSARLSEKVSHEASLRDALKVDLEQQRASQKNVLQDLFQASWQTTLAHDCKDAEIARLSASLSNEVERASNLEQRLSDLDKTHEAVCERCRELENIHADLAAKCVLLEQLDAGSKANLQRLVEELTITSQELEQRQRELDKLRLSTEETLQAQAKLVVSQRQLDEDKMRQTVATLQASEEKRQLFERKCSELECELEAMTHLMIEQEAKMVSWRLQAGPPDLDRSNAASEVEPSQQGIRHLLPAQVAAVATIAMDNNDLLRQRARLRAATSAVSSQMNPGQNHAINPNKMQSGRCEMSSQFKASPLTIFPDPIVIDDRWQATVNSDCPGVEELSELQAQLVEHYELRLKQAAAGWEAYEQRAAEAAAAATRRIAKLEEELAAAAINAADQAALIEELQLLTMRLSELVPATRPSSRSSSIEGPTRNPVHVASGSHIFSPLSAKAHPGLMPRLTKTTVQMDEATTKYARPANQGATRAQQQLRESPTLRDQREPSFASNLRMVPPSKAVEALVSMAVTAVPSRRSAGEETVTKEQMQPTQGVEQRMDVLGKGAPTKPPVPQAVSELLPAPPEWARPAQRRIRRQVDVSASSWQAATESHRKPSQLMHFSNHPQS